MKSICSRIANSLWYHRRRNVLIIVWFFLLLFILISVTIISIASSQQVDYLNANVGNSVIIQKVSDIDPDKQGSFYSGEIDKIEGLSFVKSYNAVGFYTGRLVDAVPVVVDEKHDEVYQNMKELGQEIDSCLLIGATNTQVYTLFTSAGFTLEQGNHITADNAGKPVALISKTLADKNQLKVGDSISVAVSQIYELTSGKTDHLTLTIAGLFSYPQDSSLNKKGSLSYFPSEQPANYVFIPTDVLTSYYSWYAPVQLYVNLQNSEHIESYIDGIKKEMGDSTVDSIDGTLLYDYTWDEDWASTVSKPAEEISDMSTAVAVGLGIGVFVIILLIFAMLLSGKKYEMGIYLSLGESKAKLVLQTALEELVLVLTALVLAVVLGVIAAPSISSLVMDKPASETNAAIEQQRDELTRNEEYGLYSAEMDLDSAKTTYFYVNNELNVGDSVGAFIAYALVGIVVIIVALAGQVLFFLRKSPARLLLSN